MPPIIAELGTQGEGTATRCPGEFGSDATDAQEKHVEEENAREDVSNTSDDEDSHMSDENIRVRKRRESTLEETIATSRS